MLMLNLAKLKVANSQNCDKVLYEVYPIEKVGQDETLSKSTTKSRIQQPAPNVNKNSSANTDNATNTDIAPEGQAYVSTSRHNDLHQQYKSGKITLEEYQAEMDARDKPQASSAKEKFASCSSAVTRTV